MKSNTYFKCDNKNLEIAFRIASGDIFGNIFPYTGEIQKQEYPVLMAGTAYDRPWTRDAAINVWNGFGLIDRETSKNTLVSMLTEDENGVRIGGQYWDAIIWVTGAWNYYLYAGDQSFLRETLKISLNSLRYLEMNEFDPSTGLFRGAPCYADGISAYPDRYTKVGPNHDIQYWAENNSKLKYPKGEGLPILALSTNCLYYNAYKLLSIMAEELQTEADPLWKEKEKNLKNSINSQLWMNNRGLYKYFDDPWGGSDFQDGLGHSLAIIFGVADELQSEQILKNQYISPAGIPCLWPIFDRYKKNKDHVSRHNGTVWPHIQGFWGYAAARAGRIDLFEKEIRNLTDFAVRDGQFAELYHPLSGREYGGIQENSQSVIEEYCLCHRQTWSATAYLRLIFMGLFGMQFTTRGINLSPILPEGCSTAHIQGLNYRKSNISIEVKGSGKVIESFSINGKESSEAIIPSKLTGDVFVEIRMGQESGYK